MFNIGVIGAKKSIENIENSILDLNFDFNIDTCIYNNLNDLIEIYNKNVDNWDYILFSGILLYTYINHNQKEIKIPTSYIQIDKSYLYGIMIDYLLQNPSRDFSRIYFDFLGEFNNFFGLNKFIKRKKMPLNNSLLTLGYNDFKKNDFNNVHKNTISEIKNLWNNDEIDFVFSRMPKVSQTIRKLDIPCRLILPAKENIINAFDNIKKRLEYNKLKEKKIRLFYLDLNIKNQEKNDYYDYNEAEYKKITMHKILVDFRKNNNVKMNIQRTHNGFKIIFKRKYIDNNANKSKLINYINENYKNNYNIGIGFGITADDALTYAVKALNQSKSYGEKNAFFVDSNLNAIGPLTEDECLKYKLPNDILKDYAKKMSTSPTNLSRIIYLSQNNIDKLNSNLVKKYTNITKRSANRILSKLSDDNIIIFTEKKKLKKGKGRPTKVYKINKEHKIYLSIFNNIS